MSFAIALEQIQRPTFWNDFTAVTQNNSGRAKMNENLELIMNAIESSPKPVSVPELEQRLGIWRQIIYKNIYRLEGAKKIKRVKVNGVFLFKAAKPKAKKGAEE